MLTWLLRKRKENKYDSSQDGLIYVKALEDSEPLPKKQERQEQSPFTIIKQQEEHCGEDCDCHDA